MCCSTFRRNNVPTWGKYLQPNSKNASPANKSGSNDPQADSKSSRQVPASRHASGAFVKSRTTSVNGVAVAQSGNTNSKSKKPTKKSWVVEISDPEDDDSPIPANHLRIIKTIVVPYFITIYMADLKETDLWRPLVPKDSTPYRNSVFEPAENHLATELT